MLTGVASAAGRRVEELPGFGSEGGRQALDVVQGDVSLAALDRSDEGAVQSGQIGEGFLAQRPGRALAAKVRRQHRPQWMFPTRPHAAKVGLWSVYVDSVYIAFHWPLQAAPRNAATCRATLTTSASTKRRQPS